MDSLTSAIATFPQTLVDSCLESYEKEIPQSIVSNDDYTDLIIGLNSQIAFTLPNRTSMRFRYIVVLGNLRITTTDPTEIARNSILKASCVITVHPIQCTNVAIYADHYFEAQDLSYLHNLFLEYRPPLDQSGIR